MGRVQICAAYHRKHKGLSGRTASMESNDFFEFVHDCQSSDLCGKSEVNTKACISGRTASMKQIFFWIYDCPSADSCSWPEILQQLICVWSLESRIVWHITKETQRPTSLGEQLLCRDTWVLWVWVWSSKSRFVGMHAKRNSELCKYFLWTACTEMNACKIAIWGGHG